MTPLPVSPPPARRSIPLLENGDRLSRDEFERRYNAMPEHVKAELIEGVVFMASPVGPIHANPHTDLGAWLTFYRGFTPGTETADNGSVRLDARNEPQPDLALYVLPEFGGQIRFGPDTYPEGAPELVAEIAASSVSKDTGPKLAAYQRAGVREYIVWRTEDDELDWFVLQGGRYDRLAADGAGVMRSPTFPGLWMNVPAMLRRDIPQIWATLQQGLASPEHAAFVAALQARATPPT